MRTARFPELLFEAAGARLIACDMDIDTTTATGHLIRGVLTELAQFELERTSETWLEAKAAAVGRGAPTLPTVLRSVSGFGAGHRLEPDPVEAPIVVELFELRAGGASWTALLRHFEQRTGRSSARQTMSYLTTNRAYLGELVHGSGAERLVNLEAHEAIVELELWERVQRVNRERAGDRGGLGHAGRSFSLLGGIARCSSCGRGLVRKSKRPESGRRNSYDCPSPAHQCAARAHIGEEGARYVARGGGYSHGREPRPWSPSSFELRAGRRSPRGRGAARCGGAPACLLCRLDRGAGAATRSYSRAGLTSRRQLVEQRRQELRGDRRGLRAPR